MRTTFVALWPLAHVVLVFWYVLPLATGSQASVSVVLSASMEPEFRKGDVLFAVGPGTIPLRVGDIVLYDLPHRDDKIPIVHRIVEVIDQNRFLTKGDNNLVDDRGLYPPSFVGALPRSAILGKVRGHLPWIGWLSLLLQSSPYIKALVVAAACVLHVMMFAHTPAHDYPRTSKQWLAFVLYPH